MECEIQCHKRNQIFSSSGGEIYIGDSHLPQMSIMRVRYIPADHHL